MNAPLPRHLPVLPPISASRLPLLIKCGYSARPDVELPRDGGSTFAARGNAIHDLLERLHNGRSAPVVFEVPAACGLTAPEEFVDRATAWLAEHVPAYASAEVPFAWDAVLGVARELPSKGQRDYSAATPGEMVGTADLVWCEDDIDGEPVAHVLDWKTGRAKHVDPAHSNAQMAFLALAACGVNGATRARVVLAYVADDGTITTDEAEHGPDSLEAFAQRLGRLHANRHRAVAVSGSHCKAKFCALLGICPATKDELGAVITSPPPDATALVVDSHADVAALLMKAGWAEQWAEKAKATARAFVAENGPVDLGGGKVWGPRESARESVRISPTGTSILRAYLGAHADTAAEPTASKTSLARAAKAAGINPAELFDALRLCGDITTKTVTLYEEQTTP